jgi:hypothetical protein
MKHTVAPTSLLDLLRMRNAGDKMTETDRVRFDAQMHDPQSPLRKLIEDVRKNNVEEILNLGVLPTFQNDLIGSS